MKAAALLIGIAVIFSSYSCHRPRLQASVTKTPAPAAPLPLAGSGKLDGRNYHVTSHSVVEIAEVGLLYDRHEYQLLDEDGHRALLVCGWKPQTPDWVLYTSVDPLTSLTPTQAGAKKLGEVVNVNGIDASISELFLSTLQQFDPGPASSPAVKKGDMIFGFSARSASTLLLVCWNNSGITFQRGKVLPAKEVTAAFNPPAGK